MKATKDGRHRTAEQQEVIRQQAVTAVLNGMKQVVAARAFGVTETAISLWMKKARGKGGIKALASQKRGGQKAGALTGAQASQIVRIIRDKHPEQLKLFSVLWTRETVQKLIFQKFGIAIAIRTVGDYLKKWGMTPQKPIAKAYEQDSKAVKRWLEEVYPAIRKKAKEENAPLFWGAEMGLRSDHVAGRSFKGKKPNLLKTGNRFSCNMISAISSTGKLYFSVFQGSFVIAVYLDFLKRLIRQNQGQKVIFIVDAHPVHKAKAVSQWLTEHKEEIEVHYLPGYSPELNPDELLNQDVKSNVFKRNRPKNKQDLKAMLQAKLYRIQKQPEKVQSYFKGKHVQYVVA